MSEYFITQFTEVLPKILIIGEEGSFARQICESFQQRSFNVDFFDFSKNSLSAQNLKKLQEQTYYKIVCLFNLSGNTPNVESIIKILKPRKESSLILTRFDSIIDVDSSSTHAWLETSRTQYNNILALQQALPKSTLILIRDLILEVGFFHPAHSYFFHHLDSQQLLNPQFDFHFISQKNLLFQIHSSLFAPYSGEKIIFEPKSIPALKYFKTLNYFFDYQYQIINQSLIVPEYEFPFVLKKITLQSDLDFLNEQYLKAHCQSYSGLALPQEQQKMPSLTQSPPLGYFSSPINYKSSPHSLPESVVKPSLSGDFSAPVKSEISLEKPPSPVGRKEKLVSNPQEEKFLAQYNTSQAIGRVQCSGFCNLNSFNFLKIINHDLSFTSNLSQVKNNQSLANNLKKIAPPTFVSAHFNNSNPEKNTSPFLYYQALVHISHNSIKCHPKCDLGNFNFTKVYPRLQQPQTIQIIPSENQVQLSRPPSPPAPPRIDDLIFTNSTNPKENISVKTDFTRQVIFSPTSSSIASKKPFVVKPQKPSKPLVNTVKKGTRNKKKTNNPIVLKVNQLFSESKIIQKAKAKKNILISAVATGFIALFIFLFLLLPHRNKIYTQGNIQSYFSVCSQDDQYFNLTRIPKIYSLSFISTDDNQVFANDLHNYINKNIRLEKQIKSYYSVVWQKQAGDAQAEIKIIDQFLVSLAEDLTNLQALFLKQKPTLSEFVNEDELESFSDHLVLHQQKNLALKKTLPLLEKIASMPNLNLSALLLDNRYPRSAGGLLTNIVNFESSFGGFSQPEYYSVSQIISHSAIEVATPSALLTSNFANKSGLHNLGFNRSFGETAALSAQVIDKALDFQPELVIGLNLETLAKIQSAIDAKSPAEIYANLEQAIAGKDIESVESVFSLFIKDLHQDLIVLDPDLMPAIVEIIIGELNKANIQIYSALPEISPIVSQLNLDGDPNNIMCPSNLGSETCYLDSIAQSDNYMHSHQNLKQELLHAITLTPEKTTHLRTITYDNTLSNEAASTYLSFILPYGSTISSYKVDEKNKALDEYNGAVISIKAGQILTVNLEFYLSRPIEKNNFTYSFYNQFQHGLLNQSLQVVIENNLPYGPKIIAPTAISDQKRIIFSTKDGQSFHGAIAF